MCTMHVLMWYTMCMGWFAKESIFEVDVIDLMHTLHRKVKLISLYLQKPSQDPVHTSFPLLLLSKRS